MKIRSAYRNKIRKKRNWRPIILAVLIFILIFLLVYLFLFSALFKIKKIEARGTEKVSSGDLLVATSQYLNSTLVRFISKNNYLLLSEGKIAQYLQGKFKKAKEIKVEKKFPPALKIIAKDRQKAMTYCGQARLPAPEGAADGGQGQCYYIDEEGIVFEGAPEIYGGMNVVLEDNSNRAIEIGDKAIEPILISFIADVNRAVNEEINLSLVNFKIDSYPATNLIAVTSEDWQIYFDTEKEAKPQISALKKILDEKIKEGRDNLEYIDLRIGNRVYYKYR